MKKYYLIPEIEIITTREPLMDDGGMTMTSEERDTGFVRRRDDDLLPPDDDLNLWSDERQNLWSQN